MKHYVLAVTLALTPITGYTLDQNLCEAVKSMASLCVMMRKNDMQQSEALKMFNQFNPTIQEMAKIICGGVYKLENIEILSDEGIANVFYKNCIEK